MHSAGVLIRKLQALHSLGEDEQNALLSVLQRFRTIEKGHDIAAEGDEPQHSTVILSGVACRYKNLSNGRRQILAFQFPGDVTDIYSYVLKRLDHSIGTLTRCEVVNIPHDAIQRLCEQYPNLAYALWRDSLIDTSIVSMAVVNNGRRDATERIAHLLCEQFTRLAVVGLAEPGRPVSFYITQTDIADATGLSLVHVNKTLRSLKERGLIGRDPLKLEILDWKGLRDAAGFDPSYLHLKNAK
jgi:CRP-like cAMP-binding protein